MFCHFLQPRLNWFARSLFYIIWKNSHSFLLNLWTVWPTLYLQFLSLHQTSMGQRLSRVNLRTLGCQTTKENTWFSSSTLLTCKWNIKQIGWSWFLFLAGKGGGDTGSNKCKNKKKEKHGFYVHVLAIYTLWIWEEIAYCRYIVLYLQYRIWFCWCNIPLVNYFYSICTYM